LRVESRYWLVRMIGRFVSCEDVERFALYGASTVAYRLPGHAAAAFDCRRSCR
jgi:hypothetical protein